MPRPTLIIFSSRVSLVLAERARGTPSVRSTVSGRSCATAGVASTGAKARVEPIATRVDKRYFTTLAFLSFLGRSGPSWRSGNLSYCASGLQAMTQVDPTREIVTTLLTLLALAALFSLRLLGL